MKASDTRSVSVHVNLSFLPDLVLWKILSFFHLREMSFPPTLFPPQVSQKLLRVEVGAFYEGGGVWDRNFLGNHFMKEMELKLTP